MKRLFLAIGTALAVYAQAGAQEARQPVKKEPEMNAELPDETEEADLVGKGRLQLETAFLHNKYQDGPSSAIGMGMLRYGVSERLELRLLAEDGRRRDRYMEETVQSTYPLAASAKVSLLKEHPLLPDVTFITYLKLPFTGRTRDQNAYWSPIFLLAFQRKFSKKWKLEYNGGIQQEAYSTDWVWLANASLHYKLLKNLEAFAEYFAQYEAGEAPQHNAGGGFTYELGDNIEVYISGGATVNYDQYNHFFSGGVAFRMPR